MTIRQQATESAIIAAKRNEFAYVSQLFDSYQADSYRIALVFARSGYFNEPAGARLLLMSLPSNALRKKIADHIDSDINRQFFSNNLVRLTPIIENIIPTHPMAAWADAVKTVKTSFFKKPIPRTSTSLPVLPRANEAGSTSPALPRPPLAKL